MIFFTSDTHFSHKNIIPLCNRPFKADKKREAIEVMNDAIVDNWNAAVKPEDTVFHLGDVALGPIRESLEIIKRLNGTKILVRGNHDRNFRGGKRSAGIEPEGWDDEYVAAGFDRIEGNLALSEFRDDNGNTLPAVMLSHFPYDGDSHADDRHAEFRAKDSGLTIVHGHTHSFQSISYSERGTLQIHVGVDSHNFTPVSYEWVAKVIDTLLHCSRTG